jgi:hypothetical protein
MTAAADTGTRQPPVAAVPLPVSGDVTDDAFRADVLAAVAAQGVALVHGFPCEAGALVRFGRTLGELEPADPFAAAPDPDDPLDWLGRVHDDESPRWGRPLRLHTGSSMHGGAPADPLLQLMLMLDRGFAPDDATADNGQTTLARVDDAVRRLVAGRDEATARTVLARLQDTAVTMTVPPPFLSITKRVLTRRADGGWRLCYWEKVLEHARDGGVPASRLAALQAFDEALSAVAFELPLADGDLLVVDNLRVAHGRRAFPTVRVDDHGRQRRSTRRLYNAHVMP